MVTSLDLPQVMAAVFSLVKCQETSTVITPVVLFSPDGAVRAAAGDGGGTPLDVIVSAVPPIS